MHNQPYPWAPRHDVSGAPEPDRLGPNGLGPIIEPHGLGPIIEPGGLGPVIEPDRLGPLIEPHG